MGQTIRLGLKQTTMVGPPWTVLLGDPLGVAAFPQPLSPYSPCWAIGDAHIPPIFSSHTFHHNAVISRATPYCGPWESPKYRGLDHSFVFFL